MLPVFLRASGWVLGNRKGQTLVVPRCSVFNMGIRALVFQESHLLHMELAPTSPTVRRNGGRTQAV